MSENLSENLSEFVSRTAERSIESTFTTLYNEAGVAGYFSPDGFSYEDLINDAVGLSTPPTGTGEVHPRCGLFTVDPADDEYVIFKRKSDLVSDPYTIFDVSSTVLKEFSRFYETSKKLYEDALENYKKGIDMLKSIDGIVSNKKNDLARIEKKIRIYNQNYLIDDRKNFYLDENKVFFSYLYYFIIFLYIISFILILIIINFFKNKLYKNIKVVLLLLLYIIIPFIIRFILDYSYKLYINFLEENNMRDEIVSYKDIVEDSDSIATKKYILPDN